MQRVEVNPNYKGAVWVITHVGKNGFKETNKVAYADWHDKMGGYVYVSEDSTKVEIVECNCPR